MIQLLKIAACRVAYIRRVGESLGAGSVAYTVWIEAPVLVLLCDLLRSQRVHAHRYAMNLGELWAVFAKTFWRKSLDFRFAVRDAVSRIGVIAQKLRRQRPALRFERLKEISQRLRVIAGAYQSGSRGKRLIKNCYLANR